MVSLIQQFQISSQRPLRIADKNILQAIAEVKRLKIVVTEAQSNKNKTEK